MPFLLIGLAVAAVIVSSGTAVFIPAIVNAVASFWGNGVLANFGPHEAQAAPDWAAVLSMLTTALAIVFLVLGLVLR